MSVTAFQLRRRQAAAEEITGQLDTAARGRRFVKAAALICADMSPGALHAAIAAHTDPAALTALAKDIASAKRRSARRPKPEINT